MIALYRLLLRAFPRRHRDLYAAEMIDAFERELATRRGWTAMRFTIAAYGNLITCGIAERRRHHVVRFGYFFSSLDFTLAWRMLLRYPGLTLVSVFGMAVGMTVAAGAYAVIGAVVEVKLPLPDGDRIVSIIETDLALSGHEWRMLHEVPAWSKAATVVDVSVARQLTRNLIVDGRPPEPVTVSEISPSAFKVTGVNALRGRYLLEEDAQLNADPVIVIGHDEWLRRFNSDPGVVGRTLQVGATTYTIVGVMPEGFAFPVNHSLWIPWRNDPALYAPRTGPNVTVFARLAAGATLESANAEFEAIGRQTAAESPATHAKLRPLVMPYTHAYNDMGDPENHLAMRAIEISLVLLLMLVCVNVAILVYARTATRQGEIAVRGALGASRRRIVAQLFVEALALAAVAAVIGVAVIASVLPLLEGKMTEITGGRLPFWMHFDLALDDLFYVVALTLAAASIVGVLPALKATGKSVQSRLQTLSGGGGSRMQMGPLWTLLIVAQVAATVTVLPAAMFFTWEGLRVRPLNAGFASGDVLNATLTLDQSREPSTEAETAAFRSRFGAQHARLDEALRGDPAVLDVTYASYNPGGERAMVLEAEGQPPPADPASYNITAGSKAGRLVRYNRVAANFFDAFAVPVLIGRGLTAADLGTNRVMINRTLADTLFGGANPLGRRIKYVGRSREAEGDAMPLEQWFEIIGVIPDFPNDEVVADLDVYHPVSYGDLHPAHIAIRVRSGDPAAFTNALRTVAGGVNPDLQLRDITTIAMVVRQEQGVLRIAGAVVGSVMLSVIILSAAGIYALMSFTIAKRRREIGIRAALGADRRRLLGGIFSRVALQLSAGALLGFLGSIGVEQLLEGDTYLGRGMVILPAVAIVMMIVGVIAAIGPARQGLSVQPIEALREE